MNIISTKNLIVGEKYISGIGEYFNSFDYAWDDVQGQVLKLETKQTYNEAGNISFDELVKGNREKAMALLQEARKEDEGLYSQLKDNNVDFIRCRPVILPLSEYLRWEIGCYDINSGYGEKIYFTSDLDLFQEFACHDFMVFDKLVGVVHDYNASGELLGGWIITNKQKIEALIYLFSLIKASAIDYKKFLKNIKV